MPHDPEAFDVWIGLPGLVDKPEDCGPECIGPALEWRVAEELVRLSDGGPYVNVRVIWNIPMATYDERGQFSDVCGRHFLVGVRNDGTTRAFEVDADQLSNLTSEAKSRLRAANLDCGDKAIAADILRHLREGNDAS